MKSSHFHSQSWASENSIHSSFTDVHQHLDDGSHLLDEMIQYSQSASGQNPPLHQKLKAKVLFQFFDGWPMSDS
ncbi:MAG: hypothetical protein ACYC67_11360 [Prosthecobacter sp.]|jgi:hypothetical protein